jgi:hypothetical protein
VLREALGLLRVRKKLFEFEDEYTASISDSRISNAISNIRIIAKTRLLSSATTKEREKNFEGKFN